MKNVWVSTRVRVRGMQSAPDIAEVVCADEDVHELSVVDRRRVRSNSRLDGCRDALLDLGGRLGTHEAKVPARNGSNDPERQHGHDGSGW